MAAASTTKVTAVLFITNLLFFTAFSVSTDCHCGESPKPPTPAPKPPAVKPPAPAPKPPTPAPKPPAVKPPAPAPKPPTPAPKPPAVKPPAPKPPTPAPKPPAVKPPSPKPPTPPAVKPPAPEPTPPAPAPPPKCPKDVLKLGACADLLKGLVHAVIGTPPSDKCCALIEGLADVEAAVCLCTVIKANVAGINLTVPVSLSLLLSACQKTVPPGFQC
ncbi:unnamed protein product [Linum tenue]|uniref:Bifunctional inhibitor/plant lipid transfer protein/seed storage helical domain-containing protein n=1 Tax=Linum tenue TaxID=586396 RepID=A0AAV0MCQ0_9ROSI|nr:unnamed protein product [Linum tenue]